MKTYLLTEKNVELLREEFCISKLQSERLDEMVSNFGCISHNEHARLVVQCNDPGRAQISLEQKKEVIGKGDTIKDYNENKT